MACEHCTSDKHGKRKPLMVDKFPLKGFPTKHKKRRLVINRRKNKRKDYFIGVNSMDYLDSGVMDRNSGFIIWKIINFCPICGEDLRR